MKTLLTIIIAVCALWFGSAMHAAAPPTEHGERSTFNAQRPTLNVGPIEILQAETHIAFFDALQADRWRKEISVLLLAMAASAWLPKKYRSLGAFLRYLRSKSRDVCQWLSRLRLILRSLLALAFGLREQFATANAEGATGTHPGPVTYRADAALTLTHLLYKAGTDAWHVAVCGATDYPLGTSCDQPGAAEDIIMINSLGSGGTPGTRKFRCATAIAANADLFTAAAGLVSTTGTAGMYKVGRSKSLAVIVATGDYLIEAYPCFPVVVP